MSPRVRKDRMKSVLKELKAAEESKVPAFCSMAVKL